MFSISLPKKMHFVRFVVYIRSVMIQPVDHEIVIKKRNKGLRVSLIARK
jgi:hypothetical protein